MLKCSTCPYFGDICGQPTACPGTGLEESKPEPYEFLVRLSLREVKKLEYLTRKQRKTQEKRNRPDDVRLLENIEDKLQRVRLAI